MSVSFAITVNGERHDVALPNLLTHSDVAKMAYGEDIMDKPHAKYLTCVYSVKIKDDDLAGDISGSLYDGGPGVRPRPGMRFTIMSTGNA
jgi:hypothetical protein